MSSYIKNAAIVTHVWRRSDKIMSQTFFALTWNVISWGLLLALDGGKVFVNDVRYDSFGSALAAYPFLSCIFAFPLIGIVMLYHTVALWFNQTVFSLDDEAFVMKCGPLPWRRGQVRIPFAEIKKLYLRDHYLVLERHHQGDLVIDDFISHPQEAIIFEQWFQDHSRVVVPEDLREAA